MSSQTKKRIQFVIGKPAMSSRQVRMVTIGASKAAGSAKRTRAIRFAKAQDQDAAGDQREGEQRADIREVRESADVEKPGRNADEKAGDHRGEVGSAKALVDAAENAGKQSVARHREPHAGLAELKDKQRRNHAHQRADENDQLDISEMQALQGVDDGRGVVQQSLPGHQAGEHHHHGDVKDRANDERGDDADGQVALRVFAFLGGGGDGIEADVGEENDRAAGENSGPAIGREGMPVRGVNEMRGENHEDHDGRNFQQRP